MKAIILAAGKGERLKEITSRIPKPMIEVNGKPILQHNIELCKKYGIKDIYINLHHLPEKITDYFGNGKKFGVQIKYSYEKELLGTSGAVRKIADEYWGLTDIIPPSLQHSNSPILPVSMSPNPKVPQSPSSQAPQSFFVIYGDNYSEYNLNLLLEKYEKQKPIGIIAFHYREDVSQSGVAEFDKDNRIIKFIEKPKTGETANHWVNAGIYLLSTEILQHIPEGYSDFGKDIFPKLLIENIPLHGICSKVELMAVDTPELFYKNIKL